MSVQNSAPWPWQQLDSPQLQKRLWCPVQGLPLWKPIPRHRDTCVPGHTCRKPSQMHSAGSWGGSRGQAHVCDAGRCCRVPAGGYEAGMTVLLSACPSVNDTLAAGGLLPCHLEEAMSWRQRARGAMGQRDLSPGSQPCCHLCFSRRVLWSPSSPGQATPPFCPLHSGYCRQEMCLCTRRAGCGGASEVRAADPHLHKHLPRCSHELTSQSPGLWLQKEAPAMATRLPRGGTAVPRRTPGTVTGRSGMALYDGNCPAWKGWPPSALKG